MNHVSQALRQQMFRSQPRAAHIIHSDRRNTIKTLLARQHQHRRKTLTRLNRDVDRRILATQDDDAIHVEGRKIGAQLPVRPIRVGQGHVIPGLRRGIEDRQEHRAVTVEHRRGQYDLQHVRPLGRERPRRVVGHIPQLIDELGDPRPRLLRDFRVAAHDTRDGIRGNAARSRDVRQRDFLRRASVCGHESTRSQR